MIISSIAKNEVSRLIRDKIVLVLGMLILVLLTVSVVSGAQYYQQAAQQHEEARELARAQWENQGEKNPHSAAHYGTFAFKPVTTLSVFEPGIDRYTGVSLFLEAHRQNFATHSLAEDRDASMRFAELTPSFIFTFLFPLFIILIGFRLVSAEKESGMYRFLMSQGVSRSQLIIGKALGLWSITLLLFLPFLLIGFGFLMFTSPVTTDFLRFLVMSLLWLMYFGVIVHLSVGISAIAKSSGSSMVVLLSIWIMSTLLVPRLVTNVASGVHPVPDTTEFRQAIQADLQQGIDGHNPLNEHRAAFRDSVLHAHGVDDVSDLPFNFSGLILQESEEFEKKIYDHHMAKIDDIHQQQIRLFALSSVFSPTIATRLASMAVAGTDIHHYNHFSRAAEDYRISLMRELNMDLKVHAVGDRANDYASGSDFFAQNVSFSYEKPGRIILDEGQVFPLLLAGLWFMISIGFLLIAANRREIDI